jgi:hypothetical protein
MRILILLTLLFALSWGGNVTVRVMFVGEAVLSSRIIAHAFSSIGYRIDMHTFKFEDKHGELYGDAVGTRTFSASAFMESLKEQGARIDRTLVLKNTFEIVLDTREGFWGVPRIDAQEGAEIKKVTSPQWFRVEGGERIRIEPPYTGTWYPEIAVLNRDMEVLNSFRSDLPKEEWLMDLSPEAFYLKVSNREGMKLLKEGMWIESVDIAH